MTTIEAIPGYWVASEDAEHAAQLAQCVRENRPALLLSVSHKGGEPRRIIGINRSEPDRLRVTLAYEDGRPGVALDGDEVLWAHCRFAT